MRKLLLQLDSSRLPSAFDQVVAYDAGAAVVKTEQALGNVKGKEALVLGGTGPVGQRVAGLLAKGGAHVMLSSRRAEQAEKARQFVNARFNVRIGCATFADPAQLSQII